MKTILFLDDEQVTDETYGYQLRRAGLSVIFVRTITGFFRELLRLAPQSPIIIIDVMLPWRPEDAEFIVESEITDKLKVGFAVIEKLSKEQRKSVFVLTKRHLAKLVQDTRELGIPADRVFSKIDTDERSFAEVLVRFDK